MTQTESRRYLIDALLHEQRRYRGMAIPTDAEEQKTLLRSLMNVREPGEIGEGFLRVQDEYLRERLTERGIVELADLSPVQDGLYLWKGDITLLKCGAIVNAANSGMTGCYRPCHACIDNCIHTYAGIQLRRDCGEIMARQGFPEPTGKAKITKGYNLPCDYILHTVGPIVEGDLTREHCELLQSCYLSCLMLAAENGVDSVAFCCVSTGVFGFPKREAAEIAVQTVKAWKRENGSDMKVIFNVFGEEDLEIYRSILG